MEDFYKMKSLLAECINELIKITISNPRSKSVEHHKITITPIYLKNKVFHQFEKFGGGKVIHENIEPEQTTEKAVEIIKLGYKQVDIITGSAEYNVLINKKMECKITKNVINKNRPIIINPHDNVKKHIIDPVFEADWLSMLGITNKEGCVLKDKKGKLIQINKFLEIIKDVSDSLPENPLVIDMGCGKAYLTFALYKYLCDKGLNPVVVGVDLKTEVMEHCSKTAAALHFDKLSFYAGDINNYNFAKHGSPYMAVSLHACDIATDYALFNAIKLGCKIILAAPCCQHELFDSVSNNEMNALLKHGILKEKFSALLTDSIRSALLERLGYKCSVFEFVDNEHTPKNIMIKAVKRERNIYTQDKAEAEKLMKMFNVNPSLFKLLRNENLL